MTLALLMQDGVPRGGFPIPAELAVAFVIALGVGIGLAAIYMKRGPW